MKLVLFTFFFSDLFISWFEITDCSLSDLTTEILPSKRPFILTPIDLDSITSLLPQHIKQSAGTTVRVDLLVGMSALK